MEELKVVIDQKNGVIDFSNFDELKERLTAYLEEYRGASFTEESKGFAKAAVADLRKLKKKVNDRKIEVKKRYMEPYDAFEAKTRELLALIEEPIELIDLQVKEFEQRRINERRDQIRQLYEELAGDLSAYTSLNRIYSSKWENASTSVKKIAEEMEQAFLGIRMDIESLRLMRVDQDIIDFALVQYQSGSDAVEAMRKANEFAVLVERRKKEEEEARMAAAQEAPVPEPATVQEALDLDAGFDLAFETPSAKTATYRIVASQEKLDMLEGYMNSFGYSFERIG